jgi:hypothetical protein
MRAVSTDRKNPGAPLSPVEATPKKRPGPWFPMQRRAAAPDYNENTVMIREPLHEGKMLEAVWIALRQDGLQRDQQREQEHKDQLQRVQQAADADRARAEAELLRRVQAAEALQRQRCCNFQTCLTFLTVSAGVVFFVGVLARYYRAFSLAYGPCLTDYNVPPAGCVAGANGNVVVDQSLSWRHQPYAETCTAHATHRFAHSFPGACVWTALSQINYIDTFAQVRKLRAVDA